MKILILNGAPGSGKDTAVDIVKKIHPKALPFSFKRKLVELTQAIYSIPKELWDTWYTREGKELPRAELNGLSQRQALIHVSERVIKPNFGKSYFGEQEANFISSVLEKDYDIAVCSDGGFIEETIPLIKKFGKENVYLTYLFRKGCTFEGDSRNYLPADFFSIKNVYQIQNNGTFDELQKHLKNNLNIIFK